MLPIAIVLAADFFLLARQIESSAAQVFIRRCDLIALWLIEQFHVIMQRLLDVHTNTYREVEAIPAMRAATREELYRRIHYAREYAAALFTTPITLDEMASVAGLSPNHLLRTFKQVFDQTPYQYVIAKRVAYAQELLRSTDQCVTDICFAVGFASLGAFSWWFRQRVGVSPTSYRLQNR
jgi:AraC-like DNA-binding protein